MSEPQTDNTAIKLRNLKPFKSGKDWNGNALGRPKGSISIMDNIRHIFESDPDRFQEFINKYLSDPRNRQHIVEMIDGRPKGSDTNIAVAVQNITYSQEDRLLIAYELVSKDTGKSIEELKK